MKGVKIFNRAKTKGKSLDELRAMSDQRYILNTATDNSVVSLDIFDVIDDWWGFGVGDLSYRLRQVDASNLYVRINSPGGMVTEGIGIMNLLRMHGGDVETVGIGLVASIATVILAAGKEGDRTMAANSFLMIHNPWMFMAGDADDLVNAAETLVEMQDVIANIYVNCIAYNKKLINNSMEETKTFILAEMKKESWYSAEKALEIGLIDRVVAEQEFVTAENVDQLEEDIEVFNSVPNIILNKIKEVKMAKKTENKTLIEKIRGAFNLAVESIEEVAAEDAATDTTDTAEDAVELTEDEMIAKLTESGFNVSKADDAGDDDGAEEDEANAASEKMIPLSEVKSMMAEMEKKFISTLGGQTEGKDTQKASEDTGLTEDQAKGFEVLAKMAKTGRR